MTAFPGPSSLLLFVLRINGGQNIILLVRFEYPLIPYENKDYSYKF
jgi:hypothetical protein